MSKKYVLMCDYGLDDAAATAFVLDNRKAGDSVDVMPIGGNSEKSVAYRNGQTLLARYEGSLDGVRVVDTREEEQPFANLPSIHGEDGMGDLFAPETSSVPVVKFAEWMKETDEIVLVSLGPCTLTEKIVAAREVSLLLVMGGCVDAEPNFHGYEFNHYLDITAFNACMRFPHTAVATLDTCRVKRFNLIGKEIEGDGLTAIFLKLSSMRRFAFSSGISILLSPNDAYILPFSRLSTACSKKFIWGEPRKDAVNLFSGLS